ncbi:hypothetical protein COHA_009850 [Chlorella ohadii]|uniref:Uncharacterized protein n=1 Tax=Chlorella ohadii TaxID=2649997 RepID=A0AAD5DDW8_9CHLO|nr:hypothetical protein COHA_009850 [Chlorella ohadii]
MQLLKAVPPAGSLPGMVWAKLTKTKNGQTASEALLLCTTSTCTAKRSAGTTGKYPGYFLTPDGFGAASSKHAFVWEVLPGNNPNKTAVALQQFDGTKWTTVMTVTQQRVSVSKGPFRPPQTIISPELHVSAGSPTRAVALLAHTLPATAKSGTLVTHTWDGAKWAPLANATFEKDSPLMPTGKPESQVYQLLALPSGTALLTLIGSMWRLA